MELNQVANAKQMQISFGHDNWNSTVLLQKLLEIPIKGLKRNNTHFDTQRIFSLVTYSEH